LALKDQDGVKKILLSGLRATVVMEEGKELDKNKLSKALKGKGLGLASFSKEEAVIPEAAYVLKVTGTG
jgi:hypothetical protein